MATAGAGVGGQTWCAPVDMFAVALVGIWSVREVHGTHPNARAVGRAVSRQFRANGYTLTCWTLGRAHLVGSEGPEVAAQSDDRSALAKQRQRCEEWPSRPATHPMSDSRREGAPHGVVQAVALHKLLTYGGVIWGAGGRVSQCSNFPVPGGYGLWCTVPASALVDGWRGVQLRGRPLRYVCMGVTVLCRTFCGI